MRDKLSGALAAEGPLDTPFKRAAAEWDNRIGSAVIMSRNWRFAAVLALLGWLGTAAGLCYAATRPPSVRLVTIDHDGVPTSRANLGVPANDFRATDRQLAHYLRMFVVDTRRVSTDPAVTKAGWMRALSRVTGTADSALRAYLKPFGAPAERSRQVMVAVEVASVLKVTEATWQVDWKESTWLPHAIKPEEASWRGLYRVQQRMPSENDPDNGIGFFVQEFHWNQLSQGK